MFKVIAHVRRWKEITIERKETEGRRKGGKKRRGRKEGKQEEGKAREEGTEQ